MVQKLNFKSFVTEENEAIADSKELAKRLKHDCSLFLSKFSDNLKKGDYLLRGEHVSSDNSSVAYLETVRLNRKSLNTPQSMHVAIDKFFLKKFGHRYRSQSVFSTFDLNTAKIFGIPHILFPVGNYKICYSNLITDPYALIYQPTFAILFIYQHVKDAQKVLNSYKTLFPVGVPEKYSDIRVFSDETLKTFIHASYKVRGNENEKDKVLDEFVSLFSDHVFPSAQYQEKQNVLRSDIHPGTELMINCQKFYMLKNTEENHRLIKSIL